MKKDISSLRGSPLVPSTKDAAAPPSIEEQGASVTSQDHASGKDPTKSITNATTTASTHAAVFDPASFAARSPFADFSIPSPFAAAVAPAASKASGRLDAKKAILVRADTLSKDGTKSASRKSLEDFVRTCLGEGLGDRGSIYEKYCSLGQADREKVPFGHTEYVGMLARISAERPPGAGAYVLEHRPSPDNDLEKLHQKLKDTDTDPGFALRSPHARASRTQWVFFHGRSDDGFVGARVYVHARPAALNKVLRHVVHEIIDRPDDFPGIALMKVSGHANIGARADNIVIYANDEDSARRVANEVASFGRRLPGALHDVTPPMTEGIGPGVSIGAEPPEALGAPQSFGEVRAIAIAHAVSDGLEMGLDPKRDLQGFLRLIDEELREQGIDPKVPHRNLSDS